MSTHSLKVLIFILCAMFFVQPVRADVVTVDDARLTAVDFFSARNCDRLSDPSKLKLVHTEVNSAGIPSYYVFNGIDGMGFIIIAASDEAAPVIGYSYENTFIPDNLPEGAVELLKNAALNQSANKAFNGGRHLVSAKVVGRKNLNTALWSQEAPFNNLIPGRRLTGCVGTAMAIIMKHHNWPERGVGSIGEVSFDTSYDWANMRQDNYRYGYTEAEAEAVATLMSHASQSILTDFGLSSSSAFEVRVPSALINYFGYDAGVSYKKGAEVDKTTWDNLIISEIEAGRPVLYCGQDLIAGHAFVCDGYETDGVNPYFYVNWGWGGLANGYYSSDNMSPQASRQYDFNDQTTIVYNIKPASVVAEWSPLHLTNDGNQVGMTVDVTDLVAGGSFSLRAGALKNIMNRDFSGKLSVALYSGAGALKAHLCGAKSFSLPMLQVRQYVDIDCSVPAGTEVSDGDVVRLATMENGGDAWLPVAGDLLTISEIPAKGNVIPYFDINIPASVEGAQVMAEEHRVIKGRDYSFTVVPASADKVVTVKANGFIITPSASDVYKIANVNSDQEITVTVQNAADVVSKRNLWVSAGGLSSLIDDVDAGTITDLTLFGSIDVTDFTFMRDRMKLERLDLSNVNIVAHGSNPANAVPAKAFKGCKSLKHILLPSNLTAFKSGCFDGAGLVSIEIPASVATYEYNIFLGCSKLAEVIVRRPSPAWINWCVFSGAPKSKLIVPVGASGAYRSKENWKDFKEIIEENPEPVASCKVAVQEMAGVKITPLTEGSEVAPGTEYSFTVETDDSFGDAVMEVYANSTRLYPSQNGVYTAVISKNTILYTRFKYPMATVNSSTWKITDAVGGVGLVTDVVNVIPGKSFSIRANALSIPSGSEAAQFYAAVLTDGKGGIKEIISSVVANDMMNSGDLPCSFNCQVKEVSVKEGNTIRIATSYNKKNWHLVSAVNGNVSDSILAVGNQVVYHSVTMPETVNGAAIRGAVSQVVRGMPLSIKVTPVSSADMVTIAVNGVIKVVDQPVGNLSIPAVTEDLDIAIQVNPAGSAAYTVVNVMPGELGAKIQQCPKRLKVVGEMSSSDFNAFREHAATIVDLDLADVVIRGDGNLADAIPSNAFASDNVTVRSALSTIILPTGLKRIENNAFYRCMSIERITLPASLTYIGSGAFSACIRLKRIIALSATPASLGLNPFPSQVSQIVLEVPGGSEQAYRSAPYWNNMIVETSAVYYNIQIDPTRTFNFNEANPITNIPYPEVETSVTLGLPNSTVSRNTIRRPGAAFKLYDNGIDVTGRSYFVYGQYGVKFDPDYKDPQVSLACPQDHVIEVVFYYGIDFGLPEGYVASLVNLDPQNEWKDADMSLFDSESTEVATLYKEGCDYGFVLTGGSDGVGTKVKLTSKILVVPGAAPEYSVVESFLTPDENGVFTIRNLQGDTRVEVSIVPAEGSVLTPEEIKSVDKDDVKDLTTIGFSGTLSEEDFNIIRDNFESLESLDLSGIDNESIPDNAFEGMANLNTVTLPYNVVAIGSGAFKGCVNLESITLNSVNTIGEGAFDGCVNITSVTINTVDSAEGQPVARRSPRAAGISGDSFRGINPNCLIFIADMGMASSISGGFNVVCTGGGTRVAVADITLEAGKVFDSPCSFKLGDRTAFFKAGVRNNAVDNDDRWTGIVVPFASSSVTVDGVEHTFASYGERTVSLYSFSGPESDILSQQMSVLPNVPYLVRVNSDSGDMSEVVFKAEANPDAEIYDIPLTPMDGDIVSMGAVFSLYGTYGGRTSVEGDYLLDDAGEMFVLVDASSDDMPSVGPFSVYARYNGEPEGDRIKISDNKTSGINVVSGIGHNGLTISRDGSLMVIVSAESRTLDIYNVAGQCVKSVRLTAGRNSVELPSGIYILDGIKVKM